ncbi:MAG: anthranilate phosphoribosyltransferase [Trueperaceae bacterium]|nr:MAG: anthranilate phosphoribosyltransferase [Trueperaceae bacterium]
MSEQKQATQDIASVLSTVFDGDVLSREQARSVMGYLMDGAVSSVQASALLAALRTRGETVEEIVGFAEAMRARSIKVQSTSTEPILDTCGTGGTGIDTLNISTTAAFVAASGGVKVAKHGNRGVTKSSGSADVLEALGVDLDASPDRLTQSLEEIGIAFIFARAHHPAMKFVAPIRAELKARTVFNVLGPLTNPAGASRQLMGLYSPSLLEKIARVLHGLGLERALVVHGDGIDDFTVTGETEVCELTADGTVEAFTVTPEAVGLSRHRLEDLYGGGPDENAATLRGILAGEIRGARRDVVLFNAGAVLYLADHVPSLAAGVVRAAELIDSGTAQDTLERFLAFQGR